MTGATVTAPAAQAVTGPPAPDCQAPSPPAVGPFDDRSVDAVLDLLVPVSTKLGDRYGGHEGRMRGARKVLTWLSGCPGHGWQSRWQAHAEENLDWIGVLAGAGIRSRNALSRHGRPEIIGGTLCLLLTRVVVPGYAFLGKFFCLGVVADVRRARRPDLFAKLQDTDAARAVTPKELSRALALISKIVLHTGRDVDELTDQDVRHCCQQQSATGVWLAWGMLAIFGRVPPTPLRMMSRHGQRPTPELVDQYKIKDPAIRGVLIRYLNERRPAMDYGSLRIMACHLIGNFWADIEKHHPGINTLDLPREVVEAWKQRLLTVTRGGVTRPRRNRLTIFMKVRAFYLDIAEWALEDPSWAPWAVPSPVRRGDTAGYVKDCHKTTAEMHQRIRERLPHLPTLVDATEQHLATLSQMLAAASAIEVGATFEHDGATYRRLARQRRISWQPHDRHALVEQVDTGKRTDLIRAEDDAFWAWAIIETLRHTGVRLEELLEITHLALVSYRLPDTGEIVPLLQIVPSKSNEERLLLVSPELASVMATIITRVRTGNDGTVPLVSRYDWHERTSGPPLPHLFQRRIKTDWRNDVLTPTTVNKLLNTSLERTGLTDATGATMRYTPHDFRRMFATEAVTGGLPVHIVAKLLGHANLATTQAYTAVFQNELVRTYRTFLDQRRSVRPEAEYREATEDEWREFQQHFELRKLELGTCGRPYGSPCKHEHACIRCSMLRIDPQQRPRLVEIIRNLGDRITEAQHHGWLGEVEGLQVSLNAARTKLAALDRANARPGTIVTNLGMPVIRG